ncbi:hypothetical protein FH149_03630 [Staphylococcus lugdunensis]|uniref:hypothetical protein n=1 Tax=Staphylococcus lugdunensis TaxID=28035 RepID=UPI00045A7FC4|nr:hypothetical protein [Staphylococcus lugdunensis]KAK56787.1 hypothetical protein SLVCU150_1754 [Staphylococcus lugdunensis VCU150]MCI2844619.1 hypothetical protein [Staphylococcus lugdunensis]MDU4768601.1 hypothetical protein [Staphylococcus lugdunensis]
MQQTFLRATQAGVGPSAQRNATNISTDNASWGWGPQHKEMHQAFLRTMQAGVGPSL